MFPIWSDRSSLRAKKAIVFSFAVVASSATVFGCCFNSSANYRMEDFLEQHGLHERMTAAIARTQSWPTSTTITIRSKAGLFEPLTIPYSEIEKGVALIKEHLPRE